ncbi:Protein lin-41 [Stylophora pistillata]|uniref:Protein lin-41 n=1 Tax=Stylophora pistillata TaxID=50429 RepID=A0A2B4RNT1_STYPI|nr:Protein lin-41 [Stylophora pistillata]
MSNVENIKEKANLFREEMRKLEKTSEDVELIMIIAKQEVSEAAEHKFEELRVVEVPKYRQTTFVKFTAICLYNFELGSIQATEKPSNAAKLTLKGLDRTFQAGVQAEFMLCPKTSGGEMSDQDDLEDQIQLLIKPAKDVTNVNIEDKYDGNLRLIFTPKVPGAYSVEVKINGDKLPTCPVTVQVKERELVVVGELKLKVFPGDTLKGLNGIAVNTKGEIVVTDDSHHCVYVFDIDGNCLRRIGSRGSNTGQFLYPSGILFLNDNEILTADSGNNRIQRLNVQKGTMLKSFGKRGRKRRV